MEPTTGNYRAKRWKADLETDLLEFCRKEGIYSGKGKGIMNNLDLVMGNLYYERNARTIADLLAVPKHQFLDHDTFYGRRKRAGEAWKVMNKVLHKHGFKMYTRPMIVYREPAMS